MSLQKRNYSKRHSLFERFSNNLRLTKQLFGVRFPGIHFEPEFDEGYVCPICFTVFPKEALSNSYDNPLQLEHVPPGALGGKGKLLTCKQCNNRDGSKLEGPLKHRLHDYEFADGVPESGIDVRIGTDEIDLAATLYHRGQRNFRIVFDPNPKRSHPESVKKWREIMTSGRIPEFNLQLRTEYDPWSSEIGLLRVAFLQAFSVFGYEFLLLPNIEPVRQQILNPSKRILPSLGTTSKSTFSDDALGVNVIFNPPELQSLLVVFDLKKSDRITRHGVILPGPTWPGVEVYAWLAENKVLPTEIKALPVPDFDYLANQEIDYLSLWNQLRSGTY